MQTVTIPHAMEFALQHHRAGRLAEAEAIYRKILAQEPSHPDSLHLLGVIAQQTGQPQIAVDLIRRAIAAQPAIAAFHSNLGLALTDRGELDEAITAFCRALDLQPNCANAKLSCSLVFLLRGEFERGWPLYEARANMDNAALAKRNFRQPAWDGRSLNGERVLIHTRQGFGDSIQFIRYASRIAGRGGIVIVECHPALVELFRGAKGVSAVVAAGEPLPAFDLHALLLSQPMVFKTTLATIPGDAPTWLPTRCGARCGDKGSARIDLV